MEGDFFTKILFIPKSALNLFLFANNLDSAQFIITGIISKSG